SVAQCFEHLITANQLMLRSAGLALNAARPRTVWERLPILPRTFGRLLIRSQTPGAARKFTAPPAARPTTSDIPADVVQPLVAQPRAAVAWARGLDERPAAATIMPSPFVRIITYSVLDGCRLVVAHDRRHFEQARRVMESAGFPRC